MQKINNDREFLSHLQLSDAEAGRILGRSRAAINNALGSRWEVDYATDGYFKLGEIYFLVLAAEKLGKKPDRPAVVEYVEESRKKFIGTEPYDLFVGLLRRDENRIDFSQASAVVLVLPNLTGLLEKHPFAAEHIREVAKQLKSLDSQIEIFILAETPMRAIDAGRRLALGYEANWFASEHVDRHNPSILTLGERDDLPTIHVYGQEQLIQPPKFMISRLCSAIFSMMPADASEKLYPLVFPEPVRNDSEAASVATASPYAGPIG